MRCPSSLDDRWGTWGSLELWRCSGNSSFDERGRFDALGPVVTPSLRMSVARTFTDRDARPPRLESGVVLVDDDLQVRSVTSGAAEALMRLLPPTDPEPARRRRVSSVFAILTHDEAGDRTCEPNSGRLR